jgi:small GTP-binding protein
MTKFETLLQEFPETVQAMLKPVWAGLSQEQRKEFEQLLGLLPNSLKPLKDILSLILDQYRPAFGAKRSIAIVGPANVGKSTLYNQLVLRREDEAEVSPVPGTTRQNQEADAGLFVLVDTPGADAAGEVGEREREIAFAAARRADFLVMVFEASRGIKRYEKDLFDALLDLEKPYLVVLNKMDLIARSDWEKVQAAAAHTLRLEKSQVIDTVATEGKNVGRIVLAIAKAEPELLAAIAEAMPEYQARLAWQRIFPAAGLAGVVGLTPLPIVDLLPLLGIQVGLILSIARIYGYTINLKRARELTATFGLGLAARAVFQQLSKLGGVPGWLLSAAIAAATTTVMGYAAILWFAYGEKPTQAALQQWTTEITLYLKEQLADLGQKRPDRGTLRQRLSQALQALPDRLRLNHRGPIGGAG